MKESTFPVEVILLKHESSGHYYIGVDRHKGGSTIEVISTSGAASMMSEGLFQFLNTIDMADSSTYPIQLTLKQIEKLNSMIPKPEQKIEATSMIAGESDVAKVLAIVKKHQDLAEQKTKSTKKNNRRERFGHRMQMHWKWRCWWDKTS